MAGESQKRKLVHSHHDPEPAAKKIRTFAQIERKCWTRKRWTYPPSFWDSLPQLHLTREALAEYNRRVRVHGHPSIQKRPSRPRLQDRPEDLGYSDSELAKFARHGGPDLSDLRGYPILRSQSVTMTPRRSARIRAARSVDPESTPPTSETTGSTGTKKSSPYNFDFEAHLTGNNIHAEYDSQIPSLKKARVAMARARPSLSSSQFSDGAFATFRKGNKRALNEADIVANVIPTILGPYDPDEAVGRNTVFRNLEPLTKESLVAPQPDIYYGTRPGELDQTVRNDLSRHIMPSAMEHYPLAPNFFVEVKGPGGTAAVANRQVRYYGAAGSRGMHSLQNYQVEETKYDGEAYTYSCVYSDGTLKLYAHHVTAPEKEGDQPGYHMTEVEGYYMAGNRESFVRGATAFRNLRDLAKEHRDRLIQAANQRAAQPRAPVETCAAKTVKKDEEATAGHDDAAHEDST